MKQKLRIVGMVYDFVLFSAYPIRTMRDATDYVYVEMGHIISSHTS